MANSEEKKIYSAGYQFGSLVPQSSVGKVLVFCYLVVWVAIWGMAAGHWMNEPVFWGPVPQTFAWFWIWAFIQIGLLSLTYFLRYKAWGETLDAAAEQNPKLYDKPDRPGIFDEDIARAKEKKQKV